jgi:hypothetical protein
MRYGLIHKRVQFSARRLLYRSHGIYLYYIKLYNRRRVVTETALHFIYITWCKHGTGMAQHILHTGVVWCAKYVTGIPHILQYVCTGAQAT